MELDRGVIDEPALAMDGQARLVVGAHDDFDLVQSAGPVLLGGRFDQPASKALAPGFGRGGDREELGPNDWGIVVDGIVAGPVAKRLDRPFYHAGTDESGECRQSSEHTVAAGSR